MLIDYARVSTFEQNLDLQTDALNRAGCEKLFTDKAGGARAERLGLDLALAHLRKGATRQVDDYEKAAAILPPVADDTASYCEARQRLPEEVVWDLARRSGQSIHDKADAKWLFQGRPVKLLDGSPPASRS